jgi:hypothetical protein
LHDCFLWLLVLLLVLQGGEHDGREGSQPRRETVY